MIVPPPPILVVRKLPAIEPLNVALLNGELVLVRRPAELDTGIAPVIADDSPSAPPAPTPALAPACAGLEPSPIPP